MRITRRTQLGLLTAGVVVVVASGSAASATRPSTTDLRVTALTAPASVRLGSPVTVGFSVRNVGPWAAQAATVALTVPSGVSLETLSASGGRCQARSCSLGTLRPKITRLVRVTIRPSTAGTWAVAARVSSRTRDPRPGNNSAVALAKAVGDDFVRGSGSRSFRLNAPPVLVEVDAISGPRGEDPSGTFLTRYPVGAWIQSGVELRGEVVCMTLAGIRATVGGLVQQSSDSRYPPGTGVLLVFTDNGSPGAGRDTQLSFFGSDVNSRACPVPYEGPSPEALLSDGDFTVHDKQP